MIKVSGLFAGYDKESIIKDITFEITKGTITSIIGPNGCGKSTLLKCLAKQLNYSQGEILLSGKPINDIPLKSFAQKVSYLKQWRDVPSITVESLVLHGRFPYMGFPRRQSEEDVDVAREAMVRAGVWKLRHKLLSQLSGGECQKAFLAMALAQSSEVLLLDEPTTYLDISYQLEFLKLIDELKGEGKTIVVVLHDINSAVQISDEIILMNKGKRIFSGSPERLLDTGDIDSVFGIKSASVNIEGRRYVFFKKD